MKVGLYNSFMSFTDAPSQVDTARANRVEYISNLPVRPVSVADWQAFLTPAPNTLNGINLWRMFSSKKLHFSAVYEPVKDATGKDWQKAGIDAALAQGCAPHDLLVGHEVTGTMTQAQRQAIYEEAKLKYPTIPIRPYYGSWQNALDRPNQMINGTRWIDHAPCGSRRECDIAGLAGPYYDPNPPSNHSYLTLQTENPGQLWTRLEIEQAQSFQMPYAKIALHINVMKEWLLTNEEYRLTLRQFQRDLRPDARYVLLMWRMLEGGVFAADDRIEAGVAPQGDWTPELWKAIAFISEA